MNVGNTQSQSLVASMQAARATFQIKKTTADAGGSVEAKSLLVDAVNVNIRVDGGFANRVLNDSLNDKLNAMFQEAGMDTTVDSLLQSGLDYSPEATASRIVEFATGFFGQYQGNNEGTEESEQIEGFVAMIKGAVEEGFAGAQEMLEGLGEIDPDVQDGIDKTFDLVMKGIDDWVSERAGQVATGADGQGATAI
ncbi:MAG: DUF5610 domain-containing protein [Candidatus Latescibacterota bacterium]|nr:DUF5610 domain-containing protein [Candidatus Latescibacterota bacterium]MEE2728700.1 DUF5610 domain-containing protein [Candidatus Latescibacterota bacterium]